MTRYFIRLSYDGTNYSGWQVQTNAPSVQQTINAALHKLLGQDIKSMGCGRTDAGVHAKEFYMHFDAEKEIEDLADFRFRLNCVLPEDITIYDVIPVAEKAHTRFDATERTYEYYVHFHKSPFIKKYSFYQGFYQVNWEKVLEASAFLKNIEDFTSLCLPSEDFKTNICLIKHIGWDVLPSQHLVLKPYNATDTFAAVSPDSKINLTQPPYPVYRFTVTSNRFLRGMIRKIVGTVLMIGKDKITLNDFKETVTNKHDFRIHYLAPPNGLFLSKIKYPYL